MSNTGLGQPYRSLVLSYDSIRHTIDARAFLQSMDHNSLRERARVQLSECAIPLCNAHSLRRRRTLTASSPSIRTGAFQFASGSNHLNAPAGLRKKARWESYPLRQQVRSDLVGECPTRLGR